MKEGGEFVAAVEKPVKVYTYLLQEIQNDIELFPENVRPLLEKRLRGEGLRPKEQSFADRALGRWWHDKYGFPYQLIPARNELLLRKYAQSKKIEQATLLQRKLLKAYTENNQRVIRELKKEYREQFPDQLEGV